MLNHSTGGGGLCNIIIITPSQTKVVIVFEFYRCPYDETVAKTFCYLYIPPLLLLPFFLGNYNSLSSVVRTISNVRVTSPLPCSKD